MTTAVRDPAIDPMALDIREQALTPIVRRADMRVPVIRLVVWVATAGSAALFYAQTQGWIVACAAVLLTLPVFLGARYPALVRPLELAGLAVDLAAASTLIFLTGGFASPYAALYFVTTGEALVLYGTRGAVLAALVASALGLANLHAGVDARAAAGYGLASGLLVLAAVLLGTAGKGIERRQGTVLPPRTAEDLEQQLSLLAEEHHKLKAVFRETASLARSQKAQLADLAFARDVLARALTAPSAEDGLDAVLRMVASALDAPCAALWLRDDDDPMFRLRALKGPVAVALLQKPIRVDADMPASSVRATCEERLAAAAPRAPGGESATRGQGDGGADAQIYVHGLVLRSPHRLLGILALARPDPFREEDAARASWLAEELVPAVHGLLTMEGMHRRLRYATGALQAWEAAASCSSLGELCTAFVEAACKMVQAQQATLFVLDAPSGRLIPRASTGSVVNPADHVDLGMGSGVSGWVAGRQRRILVPDLAAQGELANLNLVPPSVRSFASVPVTQGGIAVGAISVGHDQPYAFRDPDVDALERMAACAASAIMEMGGILPRGAAARL